MKELYNKFLKITENEKITEQKFNANLVTSVFTIFLSMVMLCSTTFAFFTANSTAGIATIQAASYSVDVSVTPLNGTRTVIDSPSYTCTEKNEYSFSLTATGNAKNGYLMYTIGSNVYYTDAVPVNSTYTFTLVADAGTVVTFSAMWGKPDGLTVTPSGERIELTTLSSVLIEEEIATPQYIMHTVAEGETLETIAELYGLTVEEICEYNDIPADTVLTAGGEIAIPVAPDDITGEETEDTEETEPQFNTHTVAENETLETIAALYGMTVEELCDYNSITADTVLTPGQEIKIPVTEQGEETEDEILPEELPEPSPGPSASPAPERTEAPDTEPSPRPSTEPSPETSPAPSPEISTEPSPEPEQTEEPAITPEISPLPSAEPAEVPERTENPESLSVPAPETSPETDTSAAPAPNPESTSEPVPASDIRPAESPEVLTESTPELTETIDSDETPAPDVTPSGDISPAAIDEVEDANSEL